MRNLFGSAVIFFVMLSFSQSVAAKDPAEFASLVSKNDAGEFDVEGATKIDADRAFELHGEGVVFVDVRSTWQYDLDHISGAIGLRLKSQLTEESLAENATVDQMVVFYCSDTQCYRSAHASAKAVTWGYSNVSYFAGGWSSWVAEGFDKKD
ncbi:MAG: rhodanese-like domain-containing protein [Alphaproteobacteria bacterium]